MGNDSVNIISMNSARRGMESMAPKDQTSFLQQLIEGACPDICQLPGENGTDLGSNVVVGYDQYKTPSSNRTVLLYNYERVTMRAAPASINSFGQLNGLDIEKLVTPMVQVHTPKPVKSVVKEFSMISWQRDLFSDNSLNRAGDLTVLESLMIFSQRLALSMNSSIFMSGEIPLPFGQVEAIVRKLSKGTNEAFLTQLANEDIMPKEFLPSMTNGSTRSTRHKFMLEVFRCRSNSTSQYSASVSDCFIASKELQLKEATMLDVESVLGRQIKMPALKTYAPVQTEIKYENRPARHHGG